MIPFVWYYFINWVVSLLCTIIIQNLIMRSNQMTFHFQSQLATYWFTTIRHSCTADNLQPKLLKSESDQITRNWGWQNCRPPSVPVNKFQELKVSCIRDASCHPAWDRWWTQRRSTGNVHQHPLASAMCWTRQVRSELTLTNPGWTHCRHRLKQCQGTSDRLLWCLT